MRMRALVLARHPEYVVILAGVAAALHVGKLPPAIPVLRESLGVSLVQAGFLLSLVQMAGMLLGLAGRPGGRRHRPAARHAGRTGACCRWPAPWGHWRRTRATLLLLRALEGCGFLLAVMPAPGLIRRLTPPAKMPSAMGMWGAYMPFGTALALAGGPVLIGWAGWRAWWLVLAVVTLADGVLDLPGCRARRRSVARPGRRQRRGRTSPGRRAGCQRVRRTLGARGPWLVAACFALYSGQWLAVIGFLPSMAGQSGLAGARHCALAGPGGPGQYRGQCGLRTAAAARRAGQGTAGDRFLRHGPGRGGGVCRFERSWRGGSAAAGAVPGGLAVFHGRRCDSRNAVFTGGACWRRTRAASRPRSAGCSSCRRSGSLSARRWWPGLRRKPAAGSGPGWSPAAAAVLGLLVAHRIGREVATCKKLSRWTIAATVMQDMQHWLEQAVIGLNLCPFAKAVHVRGQIHYVVSRATDADQLESRRCCTSCRRWCKPTRRCATPPC